MQNAEWAMLMIQKLPKSLQILPYMIPVDQTMVD